MDPNYFQSRYSYKTGRKKVWLAICDNLNKYIAPDAVVLELGAGYCDFINTIHARKKIAVDYNINSKDYCNPDVEFHNSDVVNIEFPDNTFDLVFASNLLEHLNDHELSKITNSILRFLKNNGMLIIIQPNYRYAYREYWDDYTHIKAFSHISLCDLLISKGFDIVEVKRKYLPFSINSIFPKSYFLTSIYLNLPFHPFAKQMLVVAKKQV